MIKLATKLLFLGTHIAEVINLFEISNNIPAKLQITQTFVCLTRTIPFEEECQIFNPYLEFEKCHTTCSIRRLAPTTILRQQLKSYQAQGALSFYMQLFVVQHFFS